MRDSAPLKIGGFAATVPGKCIRRRRRGRGREAGDKVQLDGIG